MHNIVTIIPARGGSKGVAKKNIIDLAGQPLISYPILDSLRVREISETFVSSDDVEILDIAKKFGAELVERPKALATDKSLDIDWALHFLSWFKKRYLKYPTYIVLLRTTTPIREIEVIERAINKIKKYPEATSLRSVEEFSESPYKWFNLNNDFLFPLMGSFNDTDKPRQLMPRVYKPNGYVDILKTETLLRDELYGKKILSFVTPKSVEIDTYDDFKYAEYIINS
jgi:CMP-N-acetylneuraminic acid synthetase